MISDNGTSVDGAELCRIFREQAVSILSGKVPQKVAGFSFAMVVNTAKDRDEGECPVGSVDFIPMNWKCRPRLVDESGGITSIDRLMVCFTRKGEPHVRGFIEKGNQFGYCTQAQMEKEFRL